METSASIGFYLPFPKGRQWVGINEVVRLEGQSNYTRCYFRDGSTLTVAITLGLFLERVPKGALHRLHRKHIVNPRFVARWCFERNRVLLVTGEEVAIARRYKQWK